MSFPDGSMGKESACRRHRRRRFNPWWGGSLRKGNGNPFQYSWLGNSMDRGTWQAIVHGATRVRQDWVTTHTHTHTHTHTRKLTEVDLSDLDSSLQRPCCYSAWFKKKFSLLKKLKCGQVKESSSSRDFRADVNKKQGREGWRHYVLGSVPALLQIIRLFCPPVKCHLHQQKHLQRCFWQNAIHPSKPRLMTSTLL